MEASPHARVRSAATAVAGVVGILLLVTLAAEQGSGRLFRGNPPKGDASLLATPTQSGNPLQPGNGGHIGTTQSILRVIVQALAITLEIGAVAALLLVLYLGLRRLTRITRLRWARRTPRPEHVDFEVVDVPDAIAGQLVAGAAGHRALLDQGTPRNGIVVCWNAFEQAAARVEHARKPWQTSAEFTLEILDLVQADEGAVGRLAAHYREARFSEHEITEHDRAEARRDLDAILAGLDQRRRADVP